MHRFRERVLGQPAAFRTCMPARAALRSLRHSRALLRCGLGAHCRKPRCPSPPLHRFCAGRPPMRCSSPSRVPPMSVSPGAGRRVLSSLSSSPVPPQADHGRHAGGPGTADLCSDVLVLVHVFATSRLSDARCGAGVCAAAFFLGAAAMRSMVSGQRRGPRHAGVGRRWLSPPRGLPRRLCRLSGSACF